jgi:hypothetical protein
VKGNLGGKKEERVDRSSDFVNKLKIITFFSIPSLFFSPQRLSVLGFYLLLK